MRELEKNRPQDIMRETITELEKRGEKLGETKRRKDDKMQRNEK